MSRLNRPPLILISPSIAKAGVEFGDRSVSLSEAYTRAVVMAGGIPIIAPSGDRRELMAECVRCCDGVQCRRKLPACRALIVAKFYNCERSVIWPDATPIFD